MVTVKQNVESIRIAVNPYTYHAPFQSENLDFSFTANQLMPRKKQKNEKTGTLSRCVSVFISEALMVCFI